MHMKCKQPLIWQLNCGPLGAQNLVHGYWCTATGAQNLAAQLWAPGSATLWPRSFNKSKICGQFEQRGTACAKWKLKEDLQPAALYNKLSRVRLIQCSTAAGILGRTALKQLFLNSSPGLVSTQA
eukprot:scaffold75725_cov21-Tisochrysis_lutea.AAC.3